jgi:DNA repair ATPase RecN
VSPIRRSGTVREVIDDLSGQRTALEAIPSILTDAGRCLSEALADERETMAALMSARTLKDIMDVHSERRSHLRAAATRLREAQRQLSDQIRGLKSAVGLIDRQLSLRRPMGRPSALTGTERRLAQLEREAGKSWAQVLHSLNSLRHELNPLRVERGKEPLSDIPLTTLRTAVNPRHAKKGHR